MGRKLSDVEFYERQIKPLVERINAACRKRGFPLFLVVGYLPEGGAMACHCQDEDGDDLPNAGHVRRLLQHHLLLCSGIVAKIEEQIGSLIKGDKPGPCDGDCAHCAGHGHQEVKA